MEEMDDKLQEGVTETCEQSQWNPFPVSAKRCYDIYRDSTALRFSSPDSLDQCVAALRGIAGRTLGPYADDFMGLMDAFLAGRKIIDKHEAAFGRYWTDDGAPYAGCLSTEDVAQKLFPYLVDMVLLLDAGAAFEGGDDHDER